MLLSNPKGVRFCEADHFSFNSNILNPDIAMLAEMVGPIHLNVFHYYEGVHALERWS